MFKKVIFVVIIIFSNQTHAVSPLAECMIIVKNFALTEAARCGNKYSGNAVLPGVKGVFEGALKAYCLSQVDKAAKELEDACSDAFGGGPSIEPETPDHYQFSKNPPPKVKLEIKKIDRNLNRSFEKGLNAIEDLK